MPRLALLLLALVVSLAPGCDDRVRIKVKVRTADAGAAPASDARP
jgi:hypothetical protein